MQMQSPYHAVGQVSANMLPKTHVNIMTHFSQNAKCYLKVNKLKVHLMLTCPWQ